MGTPHEINTNAACVESIINVFTLVLDRTMKIECVLEKCGGAVNTPRANCRRNS